MNREGTHFEILCGVLKIKRTKITINETFNWTLVLHFQESESGSQFMKVVITHLGHELLSEPIREYSLP